VKIDYDASSLAYARNRRLNPKTLERLVQLGRLGKSSRVLEVGCGSGNYSSALEQRMGCCCHGLEPSAAMLKNAESQNAAVVWTQGQAQALPYLDGSFDFLFCVDVIHHLSSPELFFREAYRVLTPNGCLCMATDSEWTIRNRNPLSAYFPETVDEELKRYPSLARLGAHLAYVGFSNIREEVVEQPYELERSDAYREKAFSCLQLISEEAFQNGLNAMERDLFRGPIRCVERHALLSAEKEK
jgi:ubiquinone/menaquinone biosynthesis C-methylase UbiE